MARKKTTQTGQNVQLTLSLIPSNVKRKNGFRHPNRASKRFASELKAGAHISRNGEIMNNLTNTQKAYRSGYLDYSRDQAGLYKWKKKKGFIK